MLLTDYDHMTGDRTTELVKGTHVGMAYFAGTGPRGKTCRECLSWSINGRHLYLNPTFRVPNLQNHDCGKFIEMVGRLGERVPHNAAACKYFEQSEHPPPIRKRQVEGE